MAFRWWKGGFPKFPYTNFHEANLDYFLSVFSEIWSEWDEMYTTLTEWKDQTDVDFQTWKSGVETALNDWKTNFEYRNTVWQQNTETNISDWKNAVLNDLDSWKDDFIDSYNDIEARVESIVSDTEDMIENLAEPFDTTKNYVINDYVVYEGVLYRFISPHNAGAWVAGDVVQTTAMNDIKYIKDIIETVLGDDDNVTITTTISDATVVNATANYIGDNTLKIYGTTNAQRVYLCLGGQNELRTTTGTFTPLLNAGKYIVNVRQEGYSEAPANIRYSPSTFSNSNAKTINDGDIIETDVPIMIGFLLRNNVNYGTSANPTYIKIWITPIPSITDLNAKVKTLAKNINVRYESGTWGDATERLRVYVPCDNGYIMYVMYHFISNERNCNCWQIHTANKVSDTFSNGIVLTITGEWECAIHLNERDDFSGGHTHGDEIMNNVAFLINGKPVDITTYTTRTICNDLKIIRTSDMYDPNNHSTVIAEHGVEYIFNKTEGLIVNQSLEWKVNETLTNCYMTMFLPSKDYIDRAFANSDFEILELSSNVGTPVNTIVKHNSDYVYMYDNSSKFSASIETPVYPSGLTGGDLISISDNGNLDYNKLYFKVCGPETSGGVTTYPNSTTGELWKSKTIYKLNFGT